MRVSTSHQETEAQKYEINRYCQTHNLKVDKWIDEKVSGTKDIKKRKFNIIFEEMRDGDTIICSEISRLGRSYNLCKETPSFREG